MTKPLIFVKKEGAEMTVKEYAANFDMTVNELCEVTGLSRQGLNDILVGGYVSKESQKRMKAANNLLNYATKAYTAAMEQADKAYHGRLQLLEMFYNE